LKTKTAFEVSGNSPTHGHGVESVRRQIMEAFEKIRQQTPSPLPTLEPKVEAIYTEHHEARFHARAKSLITAALVSHVGKAPCGDVWEISTPTESAEELIAAALRRFE